MLTRVMRVTPGFYSAALREFSRTFDVNIKAPPPLPSFYAVFTAGLNSSNSLAAEETDANILEI